MKILFNTLLAILFVLMVLNIMFWGIAHASGKVVPTSTDIRTALTLLALGILTALVFFFRNKYRKS